MTSSNGGRSQCRTVTALSLFLALVAACADSTSSAKPTLKPRIGVGTRFLGDFRYSSRIALTEDGDIFCALDNHSVAWCWAKCSGAIWLASQAVRAERLHQVVGVPLLSQLAATESAIVATTAGATVVAWRCGVPVKSLRSEREVAQVLGFGQFAIGWLVDGSSTAWNVATGDETALAAPTRFEEMGAGAELLCGRDATGKLFCTSNSGGHFVWKQVLDDVRQIAVGQRHVCALRPDNVLTCWSDNDDGQLGEPRDGRGWRLATISVQQPILQIAAGGHMTCALLADGSAECWGAGSGGGMDEVAPDLRSTDAVRSCLTRKMWERCSLRFQSNIAAMEMLGGYACVRLADGTTHCAPPFLNDVNRALL